MVHARYMTAEQLARYDVPNKRTELVRGRLVVREPARWIHGRVTLRIAFEIERYLRDNPIGQACTADTGFTLFRNPDTVRAPDVAYVRNERVPVVEHIAFEELAPDLVVEVRSPGDRTRALQTKISHWLTAGTRLVWVIDPRKRSAHVYRADGTETALTADDALDGEDVLPGFRASVAALVAP